MSHICRQQLALHRAVGFPPLQVSSPKRLMSSRHGPQRPAGAGNVSVPWQLICQLTFAGSRGTYQCDQVSNRAGGCFLVGQVPGGPNRASTSLQGRHAAAAMLGRRQIGRNGSAHEGQLQDPLTLRMENIAEAASFSCQATQSKTPHLISELWPHLSVLPYSASEMVMSYAEMDLAMVPAERQLHSVACHQE